MTRRMQPLLILCLSSICGCALFTTAAPDLTDASRPLTPEQVAEFEGLVPTRKIVRMQTSVMSASANDRRLRELVWAELDESGLMSPQDRRRLNQSGIRVGVSGGTASWALKSLMQEKDSGLNTMLTGHRSAANDAQRTLAGTTVAIPEGSRSMVELPIPGHSLTIPPGQIEGLKTGRDLKNARAIIELVPIEFGDGWVVVRFLPQIHHGTLTTRYSMTESGERMPVRQQIQPLYEQQFELKLHAGETAVIGHLAQEDWTVGRLLFQSERLASKTERLLAVRLEQVDEVSGRKSLDVTYSKY